LGTDFGSVGPTAIALVDVDQDGDLDLVVGGGSDGKHYVYTNTGGGAFTKPAGAAFTLSGQTGVDVMDADQDGRADLAIVAPDSRLYWARNQGGSFASPLVVGSTVSPSLAVGAPPGNNVRQVRPFAYARVPSTTPQLAMVAVDSGPLRY